jgi:hypothetical protein
MAAADVYVSFGADTGGLEAALAVAKAEVTAMTRELNKLAREMQSTGATADSELGQKVLGIGASLATAKARAAEFKGDLAALSGGAFAAVGAAAEKGLGGIEISAGEAGHAVHGMIELMMGETGRAERGFISLATHIAAANPELIGVGAAALAAAGGLGYFAYEGYEASKAAEAIKAAALVDQLSMTDEQAAKLRDSIKDLAGVSSSAAAEVAKAFMAIGQGGPEIAQISSTYLPILAEAMGTTAAKAAEKLAQMFADLSTKGRAYVADTAGVSAATIKAYDGYVAAGESGKAYSVIIDAMIARLDGARAAEVARNAATASGNIARGAALGSVEALSGAERAQTQVIGAAVDKYDAATAALRTLQGQLSASAGAANSFTRALDTALKLDKVGSDIAKTTGEIAQMKAALATATANGDTTGAAELSVGIERATDSLRKLQQQAGDGMLGRDLVAQTQDQIAEFDATFKGSMVERLQDERALWAQLLAGDQLNAQQRHLVEVDLVGKDKEIRDAAFRAFAAGEDEKATAAALNKAKVIAIREDELRQAIAIYGQGSDQALAAEQKVTQAKENAAKQGVATTRQSAELQAQGEIQAAEQSAKATEDTLDELLKTHKITMDQWVKDTVDALAREHGAIAAAYENQLHTAGLTANEIKAINNKEAEALGNIAEQERQANAKAAEESAREWKSFADDTASLINGQVDGVLRGTTSIAQAFKNMAASAIEDVIKFCIKWAAEHAATIAANIFGLGAQTAATGAAVATQTGEIAAGAAAQKAINASTITGDASRAAAGAYAAVAGIPIIGPVLAPAAAAVAFGAVEAFGSFDKGAWTVPSDMIALIHAGEKVVPAGPPARFLDAMAAGSGGDASLGRRSLTVSPVSNVHIHSMDSETVASTLMGNNRAILKAVERGVRNGAHLGLRGLWR